MGKLLSYSIQESASAHSPSAAMVAVKAADVSHASSTEQCVRAYNCLRYFEYMGKDQHMHALITLCLKSVHGGLGLWMGQTCRGRKIVSKHAVCSGVKLSIFLIC